MESEKHSSSQPVETSLPHAPMEVGRHIGELKNRDVRARRRAADTLGEIADSVAVPALLEALQDDDEDVRNSAADALDKMDARAVPAFVEALKDSDDEIRWYAAEALGKLGDVRAVPALLKSFESSNYHDHWHAGVVLSKLGDAQTLSLKILSSAILTPTEKLNILDAMFRMKLTRLSVHTFCQSLLKRDDVDDAAKEGANAVLDTITLLRPTKRDTKTETGDLLRPVSQNSSSSSGEPPSENSSCLEIGMEPE